MRMGLILFWLCCSTTVLAWGQAAPDTARSSDREQEKRVVDSDGDGIPDRPAGEQRRMRKRMDTFIDADGDGICDGREGGLGFRRSQLQTGTPKSTPQGRKGPRGK